MPLDPAFLSSLTYLATAFADYINKLDLTDSNGNILVLEKSADGIYAAGSYYDYVMATVQESFPVCELTRIGLSSAPLLYCSSKLLACSSGVAPCVHC